MDSKKNKTEEEKKKLNEIIDKRDSITLKVYTRAKKDICDKKNGEEYDLITKIDKLINKDKTPWNPCD